MKILIALIVVIGLLATPALAAEFRMVFNSKTEATTDAGTHTGGPQGKTLEKDETKTEIGKTEVVLGFNYFWYLTAQQKQFYDFATRTYYVYDDGTKSYQRTSIFADLAFRQYEYQNRVMLSEVLSKSGVKAGNIIQSKADLESLFALQMPSTKLSSVLPMIDRTDEGKTQHFSASGKEYVSFKPSEQLIPEEYRRSWSHVLIYVLPIHPEIRKQIVESERVPSQLTIISRENVGKTVLAFDLETAGTSQALKGTTPLTGYSLEPNKALTDMKESPSPIVPKTKDDVTAFADAAVARGDVVDALLAWFEWSIMTGDEPFDAIKQLKPKFNSDKHVADLFGGFGDGSPQQQLDSLNRLNSLPLKKKYVLDVYKGNILVQGLDKPEEGIQSLKRALMANPKLAGAMSDLGDCYARSYDMATAFELYDRAQAMAPHHKMLEKIDQFKAKLEHEFPEYF